MALPVPDAGILITGISGDKIQRLGLWDSPPLADDNHGKLAFIIQPFGFRRFDQRLAVADLGVRIADKKCRVFRLGLSGFQAVGLEVQANTNNLGWPRDHRQKFDIGFSEICRIGHGGSPGVGEPAGCQGMAQGLDAPIGHPRAKIDNPTAIIDHAEAVPPGRSETRELHGCPPRFKLPQWRQTTISAILYDPRSRTLCVAAKIYEDADAHGDAVPPIQTQPMRRALHGPGGLPVDVKRTRRKSTVGIAVENRRVKIYAPKWVTLREIQEIILRRGPWIDRQIQLQAARPITAERLFVDGETLPFLGGQFTLKVGVASRPSVVLSGGEIVVSLLPENGMLPFDGEAFLAGRGNDVRTQLMAWYQSQAEEILTKATSHFANRLGVVPSAITVRQYRSQWGSCSISGHIRLNRRVIFANREIAEYVAAHEVSHLQHHDHSSRFWDCVGALDPEFREHRDWLREHGSTLNV